jgi:hypothetical protein
MHTQVESPKGSSARNCTPVKQASRFTGQARESRTDALGAFQYVIVQGIHHHFHLLLRTGQEISPEEVMDRG